jgi:myo-inositol-1(or 4)-monophosphatase
MGFSSAGAYVDGKRVHCSSVSILEESLVLSGTINTMEDKGLGESFKTLRRASKLYRGWGDCYGYYLVASGRAEIMVDSVVSLWDIAPMPVIFSEAGGVFSTIAGETSLFNNQGEPIHSIYEAIQVLVALPPCIPKLKKYFQNKV